MFAPNHLVFHELVPLAVGEELLEGLRIKDRLPGAPGQLHKMIEVHRDEGLVRGMVQAISFAFFGGHAVKIVKLIPELLKERVIRKQAALPLDGPAQQVGFQTGPPLLIKDGEEDGQGAPAGCHLRMVLDHALVPQVCRGRIPGLDLRKASPVFVEDGAFGFEGCRQEAAYVLGPLALEPAGDLA